MSNDNDDHKARKEALMRKLVKERAETQVVQEILAKTSEHLKDVLPRVQEKSKDEAYSVERRAAQSINANNGLIQGTAAGLFCFFVLRGGPSWLMSKFRRGAYQLETPTRPVRTPVSAILAGTKLGLDTFVSLLIASSLSFRSTDMNLIAATAATLPLVEGKSLAAEELCPIFEKEILERGDAAYWNQIESVTLKSLYIFTKNCKRRQAYEKKIRHENGLTRHESVVIPPPGVPVDFHVDAGDQSQDDEEEEEQSFADPMNDFYEPPMMTPEQQWADSMVTDREDNEKRRW